jgi:hypothetical protein
MGGARGEGGGKGPWLSSLFALAHRRESATRTNWERGVFAARALKEERDRRVHAARMLCRPRLSRTGRARAAGGDEGALSDRKKKRKRRRGTSFHAKQRADRLSTASAKAATQASASRRNSGMMGVTGKMGERSSRLRCFTPINRIKKPYETVSLVKTPVLTNSAQTPPYTSSASKQTPHVDSPLLIPPPAAALASRTAPSLRWQKGRFSRAEALHCVRHGGSLPTGALGERGLDDRSLCARCATCPRSCAASRGLPALLHVQKVLRGAAL